MVDPMRAPSDHKALLRSRFRETRRSIEDRSERSKAIWDYMEAMPEVIEAQRLHVFASIVGEPLTAPFVEWCRSIGKQVAAPDDAIDPTWPDVVVVPGLAFTRAGDRLGQGGGWYDRFLAGTRGDCTTIGVGFDVQIVDRLPVEAHDVRLDHVVTESGVMGNP